MEIRDVFQTYLDLESVPFDSFDSSSFVDAEKEMEKIWSFLTPEEKEYIESGHRR